MSEIYFEHGGATVIINRQFSKIGACYPRVFIRKENDFINFDLSLNHCFGMKEEDFNDWLSNAGKLDYIEDVKTNLSEIGLNAETFLTALENL